MDQTQLDQKEGRVLSKNLPSLCWEMRLFSKPHHDAEARATKNEVNRIFFYPRGLNITWGNDRRNWRLPRPDQKGEGDAAELLQVSWLEVTGSTSYVERGRRYKVGFNVSLKPDAFGWEGCDVYVMAKIGKKGIFSSKKLSLEKTSSGQRFEIPEDPLVITVNPSSDSSKDCKLYFGLYEVWSQKWKGGLKIHHAFVQKVDS